MGTCDGMKHIQGFFMLESCIAIIISVIAVSCFYLTVVESRKNEHKIELKADYAYAYHVLQKNDIDQILVHDRVYKKAGPNYIYDTTNNQKIKVKN